MDKSDINNSKELLSNLTNTSEAGFFNYLESIPYNQAVDTLKKFIKKKSVVSINKTTYSRSLNITSSSDDPTPEELQQFVCIGSTQDLYIDEPGLLSDGYKRVINVS